MSAPGDVSYPRYYLVKIVSKELYYPYPEYYCRVRGVCGTSKHKLAKRVQLRATQDLV